MVYVTGDTHGDFERLRSFALLKQNEMTRDDYVIICGDFGGVWDLSERRKKQLDRLAELPFTILFIDGNHENFDLLETYDVEEWHGGKVQFIRPNVIHLMRGQVFEIDGKTFFTMGGAACHDLWNGVLDPEDPDFNWKASELQRKGAFFRVKGRSWWPQELPSAEEYAEARKNLEAHGKKVNYVITHCAPHHVQIAYTLFVSHTEYPENELTDFLGDFVSDVSYDKWFLGHYHKDINMGCCHILYDKIVPVE